ncbi:MAG TPA: glutamyl-tRNA reductase [Euryarchaeota archaeon]|nr:MAG: glutamyl-tRNA reductase [Aciduliprofundum sp.]HEU12795.1 glutamyl-tRNA reductase [Euryarchaeota archaeon]
MIMIIIDLMATYKQMGLDELEVWSSLDEISIRNLMRYIAKEYVILKTCNRFEIFAIMENYNSDIEEKLLGLGPKGKILKGSDAVRHLIEVASGMDSMVPGEQDIQRQVKEALKKSIDEGTSGKYLNYIFMKALSTSKEIRSKTRIGNGIVSIPQASVKILEGVLNSGKVAILGTGRVARTLLKYIPKNYDVNVFGRNETRLNEIEKNFGVRGINIRVLRDHLGEYDALFSALRMEGYILNSKDFKSNRPYVIIDLGNPRNIENPGDRYFVDLDYLREYISNNISIRLREMERAKMIIDEKLGVIDKMIMNYQVEEIIASMYKKIEKVKEEEIGELFHYIGEKDREYIEKFADSLIKKIFGGITKNIREGRYDDRTIEELKRILG